MKRAGVLALAGALGACAVGPDFHAPPPPTITSYRAGGDGPQTRVGEIRFDWWRMYDCAALNGLIARALTNSPDVDAAQARLRSAQAQLRAGYGAFFPGVGASFDATREKYSPSRVGAGGAGSVFSLFTPSIAVSYVLDIFGANRRAAEALRANAQAQQQSLRATYLTLAGNIASTAIARAQYHEQVAAWRAIVAAQTIQLEGARARVAGGVLATASALAQEQQVEASRANLRTLEARAAQADDMLAVLVGDPPASAQLPAITLDDLHLPADVPLRLPSALVGQRPDILMAQAAAHAASAQIGVATAALLPNITLSAGLGSSANSTANLFGAGTGVWNYGAGVVAPLFAGGSLINRRLAAKADYQAAIAAYRQTVLVAFGQVADSLTAIDADSKADQAQTRAEIAARTTYHLAQVDQRAGLLSMADLQTSMAAWQQTRSTAANARAIHLQDSAALMVALGGGWWSQPASAH